MKMIFILLLSPLLAYAMPTEPVSPITNEYDSTNGLIARLDFEQADQIVEALLRVEAYYEQQGFAESHPPVAFVIFGPPVAISLRITTAKTNRLSILLLD